MENKNNVLVVGGIALIVGLLFGGYTRTNSLRPYGMMSNYTSPTHMMPDGTMMGEGYDDAMDSMMANMNAGLEGKAGDAFDQAFLSEMIVHHQGAIDMATLALTSSKHQEIKDLAAAIISAQAKEIADMKSWQTTWYKK